MLDSDFMKENQRILDEKAAAEERRKKREAAKGAQYSGEIQDRMGDASSLMGSLMQTSQQAAGAPQDPGASQIQSMLNMGQQSISRATRDPLEGMDKDKAAGGVDSALADEEDKKRKEKEKEGGGGLLKGILSAFAGG